MCQFGLSGTPALQQHYCNDITCSAAAIAAGAAVEPDTGPLVGKGNVQFTVSFSLMATGGNASVEIFINLGNNSRLDQDGFRPFGEVRNDLPWLRRTQRKRRVPTSSDGVVPWSSVEKDTGRGK